MLVTLAAALVHTTALDRTTTMEQTPFSTTISPTNATEPTITEDNMMTEHGGSTISSQLDTTPNNSTGRSDSVESTASMAKPDATRGNTNTSSLLSNDFVFTSTWILVIAVGGFTLLTAMPLLTIMMLIVALGCVCKQYKRMKKQLIVATETVASNNDYREMTTAMNSDVMLRNIVILDGIDTDTNVAYGQTSTVVESCDTRRNIMTTQNTEADGQQYESNNIVMTGDSVAYGRTSVLVEATTGCDGMATQDDSVETDGESDYVISDVYASIDT